MPLVAEVFIKGQQAAPFSREEENVWFELRRPSKTRYEPIYPVPFSLVHQASTVQAWSLHYSLANKQVTPSRHQKDAAATLLSNMCVLLPYRCADHLFQIISFWYSRDHHMDRRISQMPHLIS